MTDPAYLVLDIETVVDGRLVQVTRFPDEPQLSAAEAVVKYRAQLSESSHGRSDFVPATYHLPVSIAIAKVGADFSLQELTSIDRPRQRPPAITRRFWRGWQKYGRPTLVTFNGRFFDLPVLELCAYRYGVAVPEWFAAAGGSYQQPRNRFNTQAHLDLQDFLGNQGAIHMNGGLNLVSRLAGGAGKMDTKGDMVQELWERGELERIDDYCMCDVLDAYLVFLRTRLTCGLITPDQELSLHQQARQVVEAQAERNLALQEWLRRVRPPTVVADEDDPFFA